MWRGTLSPRRVDVLVRGLPPDSATRMAMNNREPLWARTDYILADLWDALSYNTAVTVGVAAGKEPKNVARYPRPGDEPTSTTKTITAADLVAFRERTQRG